MPKCTIDGREVEFSAGENLIDVARKVGVEVPYFCYHPGLTVVAQCRMCAVEIEKFPKLQTACSTPAGDGMIVHTRSEKAKANQKSIMEFLLINHPLDCPVCDKSGECDLQDNSYRYGDSFTRSTEERRTYIDLDMGPVIKKNMNRCIHCTRCIRFGAEVAGVREMVAIQRGNSTEISTIDGRPLETDYAGNYADICPTGSLTLKDFRFKKRAWMLKKTATVCEGCSRGCNMEIQQDGGSVYRCIPRKNMDINQYWMCDEGRFNYQYLMDPSRIVKPRIEGVTTTWTDALGRMKATLAGKKATILVGTDLTVEELKLIQEMSASMLPGSTIAHIGTEGVATTADDGAEDQLLKRKSKTSNLHGAEKLGIKPYQALASGSEAVVIFRGGKAELPALTGIKKYGVGVFTESEAQGFEVVLPSTSFAEKDGTIVNFQGKEQRLKRAINPMGQSKQIGEIFMLWKNSGSALRAEATGVA